MKVKIPDWFYWGCEHAASATENRKIFNTNVAVLIALGSISFYGLINIATGNSALLKVTLSYLPYYGIYGVIPWLNRWGYTNLASWLFCLSLTSVIFTVMLIAEGSYLGIHFYFLLFALVPIMFFPLSRWRAIIFLFLVNIFAYIFSEYVGINADPAMHTLPSAFVATMHAMMQFTSLLTLLFIVWLSEKAASANETRLESMSNTDGLTGIWNRRFFDTFFSSEFHRAERNGQPLALAIIDVDRFKDFNDYYGHQAGDDCLRLVAQALKNSLHRSGDIMARYGGEEFVLVAPNTDINSIIQIANEICESVRAVALPHKLSEFSLVTVSVGVASMIPKNGDLPEMLFERADTALYQAKEGGRNRVVSSKADA